MLYILTLFVVLAVSFTLATGLVEIIYKSGRRLNSLIIGGASFLVLIMGSILTSNQIMLYIIQVVFLFGTIVFFMVATKNYRALIKGEGSGWLAKRVRKLKSMNENR